LQLKWEEKMKTLVTTLVVMLMMTVFIACDESSDDDDNDDNDNNDSSSEPYSWPDNPGPVEGWFSTSQTSGWELFRIADGMVTPEEEPGDELFTGGM
jgi:hypothetical protein